MQNKYPFKKGQIYAFLLNLLHSKRFRREIENKGKIKVHKIIVIGLE